MLALLEAAYAAGFFDAEGTVGLYCYDPPDYYHVAAALYNSDTQALRWFQRRWGGRLVTLPTSVMSRAPARRLTFRTGETKTLLEAICSYLITKGVRAHAVRQFIELTYGRGWNRSTGRPAWLRPRQAELFRNQTAVVSVPIDGTKPTETDKAYAAGLMDGDGHLAVSRNRRTPPLSDTYSPRCQISSVSLITLQWIQARWGGAILKLGANRLSRKQGWGWEPRAAGRIVFLKDINPHLRLKQAVGQNVLRLIEISLGKPYEHRPPSILAAQMEIYSRHIQLTKPPIPDDEHRLRRKVDPGAPCRPREQQSNAALSRPI